MTDDDDYLSDKFLADTAWDSATPKTYGQLRKEAFKSSQDKNAKNRVKSRRQRELESREEGLNKSLFEKAQEEEAGVGSGNKALAMMRKMGFTPGQPLGQQEASTQEDLKPTDTPPSAVGPLRNSPSQPQHKTEPLPINEWLGKKGIGVVKRARSPSANERIMKMAKIEDETTHRSFRDRARQEYEERKAEAKLGPAQRTCSALDEKAGKTLNVLWLNPNNPETFPNGLMDALALHHEQYAQGTTVGETVQDRLRKQMRADAFSALTEGDHQHDDDGESGIELRTTAKSDRDKEKLVELNEVYESDFLEEAVQFLRLQPQDRLRLVLSYLRNTYAYCFHCGTEYETQEEMMMQCPGSEEDDHD